MKKLLFTAVALMICLSFGLAGNALAAPKKGKTTIVIGAHLPLSGNMASLGQERLWAYQTAVDDINAAGGIYVKEYDMKMLIEFICLDDETDPAKATQAVERLVKQRKVDFILGSEAAAFGVLPGCIAAEKNKVYYHTTSCVIPAWEEQGFEWSTLLWYDTAQGTSIPFPVWDKLKADGLATITKPALFMEDTFDGRIMTEMFTENAKKAGYNIVMSEYCVPGAKDYSAQILKAKAAGIDGIILFGPTSDNVTFVRQMKENDFSVKSIIGYKGTWAAEFFEATGRDGAYVMNDTLWHEDLPFPGNKELGQRFRDKYGKGSTVVGLTYALAQVLFQAIEQAGTLDGATVRQTVIDGQFETFMGPLTYNEKGISLFPLMVGQWTTSGEQDLLYPFEWAGGKEPKVFAPWNERK